MDEENVRRTLGQINQMLQRRPWLDFEVAEYRGGELLVVGSMDTTAPHDVEIRFKDVFFVSLPIEWKTDTTKPPLALVMGEEAIRLNLRFQVVRGHHIFRFTPEDYTVDFSCLVCAKEISAADMKLSSP